MQLDGKMKPPKAPLMPRSNTNDTMTIIGASTGMKGPIMSVASTKAAKPAPKPLQGAELAEFRDAVDGSNLTKVDLLKALKKRYVFITRCLPGNAYNLTDSPSTPTTPSRQLCRVASLALASTKPTKSGRPLRPRLSRILDDSSLLAFPSSSLLQRHIPTPHLLFYWSVIVCTTFISRRKVLCTSRRAGLYWDKEST
jgi:hypothetical protein